MTLLFAGIVNIYLSKRMKQIDMLEALKVEEDNIKDISLESAVRIEPTMNPDLELSGKVIQIGSMAVENDGERIVKVSVLAEDPDRILKPGYTADVYFLR